MMTKAMDEQFERLKAEGLSGLTEGIEAARGLPEPVRSRSGQPHRPAPAGGDGREHVLGPAGARRRRPRRRSSSARPRWAWPCSTPRTCRTQRPTSRRSPRVSASTSARSASTFAVREAARARLFAQVPWLGPQLEAAVRDYARNITIDTDAIEEQVREMDLQNPAGIQEALRDKLFSPTPTAEQRAALDRLETSLALVEGWVDLVTEQATSAHLLHADALGEALRRRRVSGPAQKTFSGLVGLELRPRRLKDAKNLWAALENAGGAEFRDAPWSTPTSRRLEPTSTAKYVEKRRDAASSDDVDSALDALLRDDDGETPARRRGRPT